MSAEHLRPIVLKVGGSLFDFPELKPRLEELRTALAPRGVVIVAGGGTVADAVRGWDQTHQLPVQISHDLAVHSMSLTARLMATLLPGSVLVCSFAELEQHVTCVGQCLILNVATEVLSPAGRAALPASWDVTSDAIAAWVAGQLAAAGLIYLKSVAFPESGGWNRAAAAGVLDPATPPLLQSLGSSCPIGWINLRHAGHVEWLPLGL